MNDEYLYIETEMNNKKTEKKQRTNQSHADGKAQPEVFERRRRMGVYRERERGRREEKEVATKLQ